MTKLKSWEEIKANIEKAEGQNEVLRKTIEASLNPDTIVAIALEAWNTAQQNYFDILNRTKQKSVVHYVQLDSNVTDCCGARPAELPKCDRLTVNLDLADCEKLGE